LNAKWIDELIQPETGIPPVDNLVFRMRYLLFWILDFYLLNSAKKYQSIDQRKKHYQLESSVTPPQAQSITPICNNNTVYFDFQGNVLVEKTIVNCVNSFDALLYPGLAFGTVETVNITIYINNLISIQEVSNTASLDFFVNLKWVDPRLNMPNLWTHLENQGSNSDCKAVHVLTRFFR